MSTGEYLGAAVLGGSGLLGFLWLLLIIRLLPDRPTDVLYLRSFRTDADTAGIRTALERAFGDEVRVSGIREPRRRWPALLRFVSYLVFAFKHAHPKYMNLEAGDEWKGRLWRSLGEARGVVIDVDDLTPAVEAEIRLCVACVGLPRILFVGRYTAPAWEWLRQIAGLLEGGDGAYDIRLARWPADGGDRSEFERAVVEFANQLPAVPAGFVPDARRLAEQLPDQQFRESNRLLALEIAAGLVLGTAVVTGVNHLPEWGWLGRVVLAVVAFAWVVVVGRQYDEFRRHCGSVRRLRLARRAFLPVRVAAVALFVLGAVSLLLPDVSKVREAAGRMSSSNNLKQIGLAMHNHHDNYQRLPAVNAADGPWSPHPVSWRVRLLPWLESDHLYKRYRFDEPWDGPNNRQLIPLMPRTYLCPSAKQGGVPAGHTFYRAFASPAGVNPSAVFIDGGPGRGLPAINDGTQNTLLVVEAAEAVPWTQPECLEFAPGRPLPKLGGHFAGGFQGVLADASVRFFRSDRPEAWIRAYVTANGGEPLDE